MKNDKIHTQNDILNMYVDSEGKRPDFVNPFFQGNYVCATNGHVLLKVNKQIVSSEYKELDKPNCLKFFKTLNNEEKISLNYLKELLSKVELVDETKEVGQDVECSECDGEGVVEWEYKRWTRDLDCPVCDGEGYSSTVKQVPTGKKIRDPNDVLLIGNHNLKVQYVEKIVDTMIFFDLDEVTIKYNNDPKCYVIFVFSQDMEALIMPYLK